MKPQLETSGFLTGRISLLSFAVDKVSNYFDFPDKV